MIHFSFVAAPSLENDFLDDLESRIEFQETLCLENTEELETLMKGYGVKIHHCDSLNVKETVNCWMVNGLFSELSQEDFDDFYEYWLKATIRDNNMDEYGQLICFNSFVGKLNQARFKVILQEAI
ncbi:hypothetical protein [Pseudoalteromonas spongiae]|uniref:hypothetical protein n=1 Tax=Pseudoalteromonas spongiae TaxID=298657 RepID=UPI000C2D00E4|nr:hypothetical protein [Pseudoalteromonas spongiae]